jgi:hypothetical protein
MNCIVNNSTVAGTSLTGSFSGSFSGDGLGTTVVANSGTGDTLSNITIDGVGYDLTLGTVTSTNGVSNRIATFNSATLVNGEANFTFDGTTAYINGALGVGTSSPTTSGLIRATNDVVAFYSSDKRLKENITPITSALSKLDKINGIEFDWIPKEGIHENEGHDVGVIAQEVEKVIPEIVQTRDNGYKAVKYEKIVPLLIEAIKELQAEVQELKNSK